MVSIPMLKGGNMSRKRRSSDKSLSSSREITERPEGHVCLQVCPSAEEEDVSLEGDRKKCRLSGESTNDWEQTSSLSCCSTDSMKNHHNLQLKTVFMLTSWGTQSTQIVSPDEELLEACEVGDLIKVKKLLSAEETVNVNCVDILGRTPLLIAMERDNLQMLDVLIWKSSKRNIDTVLLHAINQSKETIAMALLRHSRYIKTHRVNLQRIGTNVKISDGDYPMTSNFYLDTTPIILASQKNLFAVVKLLLMRGEVIQRPHQACCICCTCIRRTKRDRLRFAHQRLNTYSGLASESYVTLASTDQFKEAFDLREEVIKQSRYEKYFKKEYQTLADNLGKYVVKLLNEIRGSDELDLVLNKVDEDEGKEFEPLARIRRAIHIGEKKFVTHPSCQMKLTELWYQDSTFLQRAHWLTRVPIFLLFMVVYPFLAILYIFIPNTEFLKIIKTPAVRFTAQAYSFLLFLVTIIGWSLSYEPGSYVKFDFRGHNVSHFFRGEGGEYIIREPQLDIFEKVIFIWTCGLLWMKCEDIYRRGICQHFSTIYNVLDMLMIILYLICYFLGILVVIKCSESLEYFQNDPTAFHHLEQLNEAAIQKFYWITPDRYVWETWDPEHLSEAAFAIANVLTFSRISYLLAANEILGPLQISLGRMTYDISRFTVLFLIILTAFIVGIDNLLWHYESNMQTKVQLQAHSVAKVGQNFGSPEKTFRSVFWVTFGLVEYDIIDMHPYENNLTQNIAYILLGAYMVSVGLVMLNMLIAMMSRSFDQIEQDGDIEFKFARSKLYLEYIEGGTPLPVPLNVFPTANTFRKHLRKIPFAAKFFHLSEKAKTSDISTLSDRSRYRGMPRKPSSGVAQSEVLYSLYEHAMQRIRDRFISEVTRMDDDETEKKNNAEMVRQQIHNFQESDKSNKKVEEKTDLTEMKDCLSQLTSAVDKFIKLQEQTSNILSGITMKVDKTPQN